MTAVVSSQAARLVAASWSTRQVGIPADVVERLQRAAAAEGAPREAVYVGAVMALLTRYAAREDVALVVHRQGRGEVVRAGIAPDLDRAEVIRRAASAMAVATRDVAVRGQHFVPGAVSDAVDVAVVLDASRWPPATDLAIRVKHESLELRFCDDRFEHLAMDRIAAHLRAILSGFAEGPGSVGAISIVRGEERDWVLARSNVGAVRLEEALPNVVELFESRVQESPHAVAVVDGGREFTYVKLDDAARVLARELRARGVGPGVRVAVYLERGADAVIALLAVLRARGAYVPIDTAYPAGRVEAILASAAPRLVVTRASLASALPERASAVASLLLVDRDGGGGPRDVEAAGELSRVRPDDTAYTFFTSGSTGQPKGVAVDHRALANYARAAFDAYGVHSGDRVLQAASLGFDLSLEEILVTLTSGATLVVRSAAPIESVQGFLDECVQRRLTVLSITSALWHELTMRLADGSAELPPLVRLVILGADVARPDVLESWRRATAGNVRLVNTYGLTETTIVATVWEAPDGPLEGEWRALPIGRPLRNVSTYVLDAAGELVPVGVAGEICVGGLAVASGYLGDEALNASRFFADRFLPGGRMYRTGDRGVLRSTGELEFLGRADYRIKVGGVRVELGEIEARLREFPGVVEAIVVARTGYTGETELEAHAMVSSAEVTPDRLRIHLARLLPLSTVPARMSVVDRFPLTPAGKIDRRALSSDVQAVERAAFVEPQSVVEKLVAATVAEVLGVGRVGMDDHFLSMGGFSLAAVRAASILEHRLGRRVRGHLFLESRTLREVCAELEEAGPKSFEREILARALEREITLDPNIARTHPPVGPSPLATVLLTGATGYYGTFVLAELLRTTAARVVCVVRARTPDAARERVEGSLRRRRCHVDPSILSERVVVECGDVARPDLGLAPEVFRGLSESVDTIVHCAAQVSMLLPYEALRASNVTAVHSVLRFATTGREKTVHHVSTVEVLEDVEHRSPGAGAERRASSSASLLESGYAQSKWVAEKLVELARGRGVRAFIHRPGRLMGHSSTGAFHEEDFLVGLLDACGLVGSAPALDVTVDVTPVDYASRALVRLAQAQPEGEAFHFVAPEPPSWADLVGTIVGLGYPLRVVSFSEWQSLLLGCAAAGGRADFLVYLSNLSRTELEASIRGGHESSLTRAALGGDCACPPIDAALLETYLLAQAGDGRFALARSAPRAHADDVARRASPRGESR